MDLYTSPTQTRRLMKSVTINRPAVRLYQGWRDLSRRQTASALPAGSSRSGAQPPTISAPGIAESGSATTRMAELALEIPGMLIAWRSLPIDDMVQAGEVWFSPLPHDQSEVRLILTWQQQSRDWQQTAPHHADSAEAQVELDLMRFKRLMED